MSENARVKSTTLLKLVGMIVVAGALVAGLLLPVVGGGGMVARSSANLLNGMPDELTDQMPAGNSKVLAVDGSLITDFYKNNRVLVTSDQIAAVMKQAQVDIEDSRFYEHSGVDVQGTVRALVRNVAAGSVEQGGSTLTQQLVKQTLLQTAKTKQEQQAAVQQSVGRKIREARLAMALEQKYSKDEILTRYLNIVYFGEGAYGIEAAALRYFGVHAKDLTLPQAAMLAGLVQSPTNDDPIAHPDHATKRRNEVLQRMHQLGHVDDKQLAEATGTPVQVTPAPSPPNGCINATLGGFFCAYVHDYLVNKLGLTDDQIDNGGLTIQTTLDPTLQRSADQGVLNHAAMGDKFAGVLDALEPGTGHVLAMSENRQYGCGGPGCESVNLNVKPSKGSGSTYKVFTAAYALSQGFGAHYTITAPQPYTSKVFKGYRNHKFGPLVVSNDDPNYKATYDMTSGLVASSNTYYVALEDALGGVDGPVQISEAMGMHYDAPNQDSADKIIKNEIGVFTLGYNATSPLDLASAYSTLAANGTQCDPTPVTKVLDRTGQPMKDANGQLLDTGDHCKPNAIPPGVADTLNQMMIGVVTGGTGRKAAIPGHDIAGKTGTTQDNETAAFVGNTPKYTVSVMYFDPKGNAKVGGVGGGVPAQMYHDTMAPIFANQPNTPFPPADPAVENGKSVTVPACSSVNDCVTALDAAALRYTIDKVDSSLPSGAFVGTNPPAGSPVNSNQAVSIQVSNGTQVQPSPAPAPAPAPVVNPPPPAPGQRAPGGGHRGGGGGGGHGGGGGNG